MACSILIFYEEAASELFVSRLYLLYDRDNFFCFFPQCCKVFLLQYIFADEFAAESHSGSTGLKPGFNVFFSGIYTSRNNKIQVWKQWKNGLHKPRAQYISRKKLDHGATCLFGNMNFIWSHTTGNPEYFLHIGFITNSRIKKRTNQEISTRVDKLFCMIRCF